MTNAAHASALPSKAPRTAHTIASASFPRPWRGPVPPNNSGMRARGSDHPPVARPLTL
jgi:hypothetical protein